MRFENMKFRAAVVLAAATTLGAGHVRAEGLLANVPFKFRVRDKQYQPGEYRVTEASNNGIPVLLLRQRDGHDGVLILPRGDATPSKDERPRMVFQCGEAGCVLSEIWGATASGGGLTVTPPHKSDNPDRATLVYMKPANHHP